MTCPDCGYDRASEGSRFCPDCDAALHTAPQPVPGIRITQDVGQVGGGKVVGLVRREPGAHLPGHRGAGNRQEHDHGLAGFGQHTLEPQGTSVQCGVQSHR